MSVLQTLAVLFDLRAFHPHLAKTETTFFRRAFPTAHIHFREKSHGSISQDTTEPSKYVESIPPTNLEMKSITRRSLYPLGVHFSKLFLHFLKAMDGRASERRHLATSVTFAIAYERVLDYETVFVGKRNNPSNEKQFATAHSGS